MFIWSHTASPPQHVASLSETAFAAAYPGADLGAYLVDHRARFRVGAVALITEDPRGETAIHVFDTVARADAWTARNVETIDVLIRADLP